MKPVCFVGDSLRALRRFPKDARQAAGYQLEKVQRGKMPDDFKSMPSVGPGWKRSEFVKLQERGG